MEKKWRNCELHNVNDAEAIRAIRVYCNTHHIPYETSDAGYELTHFEIYCNAEQAKTIDDLLDTESNDAESDEGLHEVEGYMVHDAWDV